MNTPRILQWGLLLYEAVRLAVLTWIMVSGFSGEQLPSLIFGAANALFLLMALFLLVDIRRYGAYASLYVAGKVLAVVVLISCAVFGRDTILQAIMLKGTSLLYTVGSLLGIAIGDLISTGGGILLARYSKQADAMDVIAASKALSETTADDGRSL
ncbi:MAG: hypothetical protein LBT39_01180 [Treponema sp.]|jgi:hypothetical protein|nr:hypothetical protein [Treponema sp.]